MVWTVMKKVLLHHDDDDDDDDDDDEEGLDSDEESPAPRISRFAEALRVASLLLN